MCGHQGEGCDAGVEPLGGAARHLHPRLEDAEHGIEEGGGVGASRHRGEPGPGEVAERLVPCALLGPRRQEVE